MSEDKREAILAQLLVIADGLKASDDIKTSARNVTTLADTGLPLVAILDGDEAVDEANTEARGSTAPRRMAMTPEIYLKCAGKPELVGTLINALRIKFIKAVLSDAPLAAILGSNGIVRYDGCATTLALGRAMDGTMKVDLTIIYYLVPEKL